MTPGDHITVTHRNRTTRPAEVIDVRGDSLRIRYTDVEHVEVDTVLRARCRPVKRIAPIAPAPVPAHVVERRLRNAESIAASIDTAYARAFPKPPKPLRDAAYMKWVRDVHSCCAIGCGMPAEEAHHHGPRGISQKTDDYRVVPLCARCHREVHAKGHPDMYTRESWEAHVSRTQAGLIHDYLNYRVTGGDMTCVVDALIAHIRETAA